MNINCKYKRRVAIIESLRAGRKTREIIIIFFGNPKSTVLLPRDILQSTQGKFVKEERREGKINEDSGIHSKSLRLPHFI